MKKFAFITSAVLYLSSITIALADDIIVKAPEKGGFKTIGDFISNVLTFVFALAILAVLIMLIWGAFEWITSGGDKETVAKARNKILNALIGLAVLAVAFALANVGAKFVGLDLGKLTIPTPNPSPAASGTI